MFCICYISSEPGIREHRKLAFCSRFLPSTPGKQFHVLTSLTTLLINLSNCSVIYKLTPRNEHTSRRRSEVQMEVFTWMMDSKKSRPVLALGPPPPRWGVPRSPADECGQVDTCQCSKWTVGDLNARRGGGGGGVISFLHDRYGDIKTAVNQTRWKCSRTNIIC
jgi:hypothetical protein